MTNPTAAISDRHETSDVLIIGAGISGIGAACHLQMEAPGTKVRILERRDAIGGTWDLFRYPGIRSDSDMYTLGYEFRPWMEHKVLADGASIRRYVEETAEEYGVRDSIRFGLKSTGAAWDSQRGTWTVTATHERSGETRTFEAKMLLMCTGYYNYDRGYTPHFEGRDDFDGTVVHPQFWPEDLDYAGKNVVVVGSGATAVTLVPAMADQAKHVTMLQRSPTYYLSVPGIDKASVWLTKFLPKRLVFGLIRRRNILQQRFLFRAATRNPGRWRKILIDRVAKHLGADFDAEAFTPRYDPWQQRLCAVPDGDLYRTIKSGKASVVTDRIERFTKTGIRLESGKELDADVIVTATGLDLKLMGGVELSVDGEAKHPGDLMTYKGTMLEGVPNLGFVLGYVNASWTLKVDLAAQFFARLWNYLRANDVDAAWPQPESDQLAGDDNVFGGLNSGYIQRGASEMPRQGKSGPWRFAHDRKHDRKVLLEGPIEDSGLAFKKVEPGPSAATADGRAHGARDRAEAA